MKKYKEVLAFVALATFSFILGCGGSGGGTVAPPPAITVSVSPATASVRVGASQQFTATVTGTPNTAVVWQVNGITGGNPATVGAIDTNGKYTAPNAVPSGAVTVAAVSQADPAKSGSATVTVLPPIRVSIAPSTATVTAGGNQSFNATVTGATNPSMAWSVSGVGTVSFSGMTAVYTAPLSVPSPTSVTLTATATEGLASGSGTATVTVNPVPVAPTITGLPSAATVAFGNSKSFPFQKTGTPDPTVTCTVTGTGTCSISGDTVSYTLLNPASAPASFTDTLTLTVQNSAGTASASATINLTASITSATVHGSVDPQAAFCARYNCSVTVDIVGTGFFGGKSAFLQDLIAPVNGVVNSAVTVTDSSHATMINLIGKGDFGPKPWHIGVREPGPCCGFDSNVANFVFLGNLDTMDTDASRNHAAQLTQSSGVGKVIDLSTGSTVGSFGSPLVSSLAVDNATGDIVIAETTGFDFIDPGTGNFLPIGGGNGQLPLAVTAQGGYMCGSQDVAGQIVSLQIVSLNSTLVPLIVGNTPWQTAMLTLNNQLVCTVFNVGDLKFTVAPIPIPSANPAPLWTLPIAGLTPLSQIPSTVVVATGNIMPNGGWPLIASQSANKAAILSRFDRKVAIVDLLSKTQTQTVDLTPSLAGGVILRMAADNTNKKAVISLAKVAPPTPDFGPESSTFLAVDLTTGAVSKLNATTPFYATDVRVSQDGKTLYCGDSAGRFLKVPNQ